MDIKERIERHLKQLSPHVKKRETSELLTAAVVEIDRLREAIEGALAQLDEDDRLFVELQEALKMPNEQK